MKSFLNKTLSEIDSVSINEPSIEESNIEHRYYQTVNKMLADISNEDLCFVFRQIKTFESRGHKNALECLVPLALDRLKNDLFAEGLYPGDLLYYTVRIKPDFWKKNKVRRIELKNLLNDFSSKINSSDELMEETKEELSDAIAEFLIK